MKIIDAIDFQNRCRNVKFYNKQIFRMYKDLKENMIAIDDNLKGDSNKFEKIGHEVLDIMKNEIINASNQDDLANIVFVYYSYLRDGGENQTSASYLSFYCFRVAYSEVYNEIPFEIR